MQLGAVFSVAQWVSCGLVIQHPPGLRVAALYQTVNAALLALDRQGYFIAVPCDEIGVPHPGRIALANGLGTAVGKGCLGGA